MLLTTKGMMEKGRLLNEPFSLATDPFCLCSPFPHPTRTKKSFCNLPQRRSLPPVSWGTSPIFPLQVCSRSESQSISSPPPPRCFRVFSTCFRSFFQCLRVARMMFPGTRRWNPRDPPFAGCLFISLLVYEKLVHP